MKNIKKYKQGGGNSAPLSSYLAFTLAEMMVVMLIMSIVLAAMAPVMTTRMKKDQQGGMNSSPWSWAGNIDTYFKGLDDNSTVMIGQREKDNNDEASRLTIKTPNDNTNHILFKNNDSTLGSLKFTPQYLLLGSFADEVSIAQTDYDITAIGEKVKVDKNFATAVGSYAISIGESSSAFGAGSIAIGKHSTAIGDYAYAGNFNDNPDEASRSTAVGDNAIAYDDSVALGYSAQVKSYGGISIGHKAYISDNATLSIGRSACAKGINSVAIGFDTCEALKSNGDLSLEVDNYKTHNYATALNGAAYADGAVSIGPYTIAKGVHSIAIGSSTKDNYQLTSPIYTKVDSGADYAVAIGYNAQVDEDSKDSIVIGNGATASGSGTIALGKNAYANRDSLNNPAIAIGVEAHSGKNSIAIGYRALKYFIPDNGGNNVAIGNGSMSNRNGTTTSAYNNVAIGNQSLQEITTGGSNVAVGFSAMQENKSGFGNVAVGTSALSGNIKGDYNTVVGHHACVGVLGSNKTCIGAFSGPSSTDTYAQAGNTDSVIFLGAASTKVSIHGELIVQGNINVPNGDVSARGVKLTSDRRLKNIGKEFTSGLDIIHRIKPYNFTFKEDKEKTPRVGVIAQDLQKIFPNAVKKGADGFLTIRMEDMFYAVINAIKELDLKYRLQEKRINELEKRVQKLEQKK